MHSQVDHGRDTGVAVTAAESLARRVCQHLLGCTVGDGGAAAAGPSALHTGTPHVEAILCAVGTLRSKGAASEPESGPWTEVRDVSCCAP